MADSASELSHALNQAPHPPLIHPSPFTSDPAANQREEEEEDIDEVEEQLNSFKSSATAAADNKSSGTQPDTDGKPKRGPGRPRGSRTSKKTPATKPPTFFQYPPPPAAPQNAAVHPQHQQYYEFQWRALNLCSEFYNAAEELVKATPPLVIAQCYQMGPSPNKVDPLGLITEAKRVCDSLLANPSQLVNNPPPAVYPSYGTQPGYGPTVYPPQYPTSYAAPGYAHGPSYAVQAPAQSEHGNAAPVISNPQSFVMPLGPPAMAPAPSYTVYSSRYPASSYYPPYPSGSNHYPSAPVSQNSASAPPATTPASNTTTSTWATGYNQGSWSDEEVERLKQITAQSQEQNSEKGEIDWDWVITTWGNSRTRHQILLKATSMGLKESTTRGVKRRRADGETEGSAHQPSAESASTSAAPPTAESPVQSSSESRAPSASPAMSTLAHPTKPTARPNSTTSQPVRWALPTVPQSDGAYYRQRSESFPASQKTNVQHQFMFAPGSANATGSV